MTIDNDQRGKYIDEDGRYPIRNTDHAMRIGRALEVAARELELGSIVAVVDEAGGPTAAFVVRMLRADLTLTIVVQ